MNDFKDIKIAVAGTGYVGLSIATLLSQHHHVTAVAVSYTHLSSIGSLSQVSWLQPKVATSLPK